MLALTSSALCTELAVRIEDSTYCEPRAGGGAGSLDVTDVVEVGSIGLWRSVWGHHQWLDVPHMPQVLFCGAAGPLQSTALLMNI